MKAEITIRSDGRGTVVLDGQDVTGAVRGFQVAATAGKKPQMRLDVLIRKQQHLSAEVEVSIPDATADLLRKLGWTPPPADTEAADPQL